MTVDLRKDKIFRLCDNVGSGGTPDSSNPDYYDGAIRWVQTGDLNDGLLSQTEKTITNQGLESSSAKVYPAGTLLIAMYGATIGKMSILEFSAATNQACCAMNFRSIMDTKYMFYKFLDIREPLIAQGYGGGQQNISQEIIKQTYIFFPRIEEQSLIAAYLDKTCAAIDMTLEKKQKQLETLNALRKSIIHKAVTRGLDDSVEVKDSGVEWLGNIPVHWQIKRIKDIVDLKSGDAITSDSITPIGNYPVFGGNGLRGYTISYTHDGYYVLIGRQGALCGNINYAEGKFWASEHAVVAIALKKHDTLWLGELLRVMNLNQYSNAAAQPGLAVDRIKYLRIPIPPYEEQLRITSWLKNTIIKNEAMISILQKQIDTLTAYRKALIHECVTGKRRINEAHLKEIEAHV